MPPRRTKVYARSDKWAYFNEFDLICLIGHRDGVVTTDLATFLTVN